MLSLFYLCYILSYIDYALHTLSGSARMTVSEKLLSCLFLLDVLCSYRKSTDFVIMARCFKCKEYIRFNAEMDEEDEATDRFVEWAHANPEAYLRREQP